MALDPSLIPPCSKSHSPDPFPLPPPPPPSPPPNPPPFARPPAGSCIDFLNASTSGHETVISVDRSLPRSASLPSFRGSPAARGSALLPGRPSARTISTRRFSLLNAGFWASVELFATLVQILAAIIVLALSQNERPETPLPVWLVGYAVGCAASLPILFWRYTRHPSMDILEQESLSMQHQGLWASNTMPLTYPAVSQLEESNGDLATRRAFQGFIRVGSIRIEMFMERLRLSLDCFFAVWFVLGNVWVFGRPSSAQDSPKLYRLCVVFLTLSCVKYAMPFILCAAVCCCLPCVISLVGFRENRLEGRGASPEVIAALPIYKFRSKRVQSHNESKVVDYCNESDSETSSEGGVMAAGTENERVISGDDAACCICLRRYRDNAELRGLPCGHHFHVDCVDEWLKINASCPLCKFALQAGAGKDGEDSVSAAAGTWRGRRLYEEV